ncbi:hypothetical protein BC629DRAFT_308966 [Irpex lacteus]|nr:hypothetical protein BC629DRAFT_308966 [Irpex lacteus]
MSVFVTGPMHVRNRRCPRRTTMAATYLIDLYARLAQYPSLPSSLTLETLVQFSKCISLLRRGFDRRMFEERTVLCTTAKSRTRDCDGGRKERWGTTTTTPSRLKNGRPPMSSSPRPFDTRRRKKKIM